jgi:hypothetical protein
VTKEIVAPQIFYNYGIKPVGVSSYGEILKEFADKHPKIILITAPNMVNYMVKEIERVGINLCRFVPSIPPETRGAVLEEFNATPAGTSVVLITTPMLASKGGWKVNADSIILADCFINLEYGSFDKMINRAKVKEVHLVHCIFTNREIQKVWKMRDIRTLQSAHLNPDMLMTTHGTRSIQQVQGLVTII